MTNIQSQKNLSLHGTIDRLEGNWAVIRIEDGQTLNWPISILPNDTTEGEAVEICLHTNKTETLNNELVAKAVLNEIFQTNDD